MKLTEYQRKEAIEVIIENDLEGLYKYRDQRALLYHGVLPYKDLPDEEIIEWYNEREMDLPKEV